MENNRRSAEEGRKEIQLDLFFFRPQWTRNGEDPKLTIASESVQKYRVWLSCNSRVARRLQAKSSPS